MLWALHHLINTCTNCFSLDAPQHWGPFSQRVPYDGQYPGASWKLDYFVAGALAYWRNSTGGRVCPAQPTVNASEYTCPTVEAMNGALLLRG